MKPMKFYRILKNENITINSAMPVSIKTPVLVVSKAAVLEDLKILSTKCLAAAVVVVEEGTVLRRGRIPV